jgi:hypothetical protein
MDKRSRHCGIGGNRVFNGGLYNKVSPEEKAAKALLKALQGNDTAALEKALSEAGSAGLASLIASSASPASDFTYRLNTAKTGIRIQKYTGNGGVVIVPEKIEDYPVVMIEDNAFAGSYEYEVSVDVEVDTGRRDAWGNPIKTKESQWQTRKHEGTGDNITVVVLPDTIEEFWRGAFRGCTRLHTINIPASTKSIGDGAFNGCTELYNFTIPDTITELNWSTYGAAYNRYRNVHFRGCGKLKLATRDRITELGYKGDF